MSTINVEPIASNEDLDHVVDIEERAYGKASPLLRLMFPTVSSLSPETLQKSKGDRHRHVWKSDPTACYIKAVTSEVSQEGAISERIVGAAVYHIYGASLTDSEQNPWPKSSNEVPAGANEPLCLHYFQTLTEARLQSTNGEPHAYLANLVVEPSFQGRGIGTKLIEFMTADIMAELGHNNHELQNVAVVCWLDASPSGLSLYRRLGWEEVGEKQFHLEQWGGIKGQSHKNVHMVRWISISG
ncbi:hypothetical protein ACHAPX_003743 [Trichoderma viride]